MLTSLLQLSIYNCQDSNMKQKGQFDLEFTEAIPQRKLRRLHELQNEEEFVSSPFTSQYLQEIQPFEQDENDSILQFQKNNINYNPVSKYRTLSFQSRSLASSNQYFMLKVKIAKFQLQLSCINIAGQCSITKGKPFAQGNFGAIYILKRQGQYAAIKCISLNGKQSRQTIFSRIVKEVAILKICEALELGPRMKRYLGFDLVIFTDYVIFSMQKCQIANLPEHYVSKMLSKLHFYNIVHMDIKPDNFMYSTLQQKIIFIDFGFSDIIKQSIGYKTLTKFRGTPQFCSNQMLDLFADNNVREYIDLYHNDYIAMVKSIQKDRQGELDYESPSQEEKNQYEQVTQLPKELTIILFKASILNEDYFLSKKLLNADDKYLLKQRSDEVIRFFNEQLSLTFPEDILSEEIGYLQKLDTFNFFSNLKKNHILFYLRRNMQKPYLQEEPQKQEKREEQNCSQYKIQNYLSQPDYYQGNELYDIDNYQNQTMLFLQSLLNSLRFDKINMDIQQKSKLSSYFLRSILKNRNIEIVSSDDQTSLSAIRQTFKYLYQYCRTDKINTWKKQHIFDIIYQMILLKINAIQYLQYLSKNAQSKGTKLIQKLNYLMWLKKYLTLISNRSRLNFIHSDLEQIKILQQILKQSFEEVIDYTSASNSGTQRKMGQILIYIQQNGKSESLCYRKQRLIQFQNIIEQIEDRQIELLLKYEVLKILAIQFSQNAKTKQFFEIYQKINRIFRGQEHYHTNSFFHLLIDIYFNLVQTILVGYEIQPYYQYIKRIINCDEVYLALKFGHEYLYRAIENNKMLQFFIHTATGIFQNQLSIYLIPDFIEILQTVVGLIQSKQYYDYIVNYYDLVDVMLIKYYKWKFTFFDRQKVDKKNLNLMLTIIDCQIMLTAVSKRIQQTILEYIEKLENKLGMPKFTRDQAAEYIENKPISQFLGYIQLLYYHCCIKEYSNHFQIFERNFQIVRYISERLEFPSFLLTSLCNAYFFCYSEKIPSKSKYLQKILEISKKEQSFIFYLKTKTYLIVYVLQNFAEKNDLISMREFLNLISCQLASNPVYFYINTFIVNMTIFYNNGYQRFFQYKIIKQIVGNISWNSRYLILILAAALHCEQEEEHIKLLIRDIVKFIPHVYSGVIKAILPFVQNAFRELTNTPNRKRIWLLLRRGVYALPIKLNRQKMKSYSIIKKCTKNRFEIKQFIINEKLQRKLNYSIIP